MAEPSRSDRLQPSLLDRLTDQAPDKLKESLDQQSLTMPQLRAAVLRDLAWLLNTTRVGGEEIFEDFPRAAATTINYGVPGFAGRIGEADASEFETWLAAAIVAFEPRLSASSVEVRLRPAREDDPLPALAFDITGELWAQPVPQTLFVETSIEVETQAVTVTEVKQANR